MKIKEFSKVPFGLSISLKNLDYNLHKSTAHSKSGSTISIYRATFTCTFWFSITGSKHWCVRNCSALTIIENRKNRDYDIIYCNVSKQIIMLNLKTYSFGKVTMVNREKTSEMRKNIHLHISSRNTEAYWLILFNDP